MTGVFGDRWRTWLGAACAAALLLMGCEGVMTGAAVESVALEADAAGGYKPVQLALTADMSPVALNLRAEHGSEPHEMGKWNRYRATLSRGGTAVASGEFNINNTATPEGVTAPYAVQTMLITRIGESGEYELTIRPVKPVEVALKGVRVEVRRNVQEPPALPMAPVKP
jgi:hypothetical protein